MNVHCVLMLSVLVYVEGTLSNLRPGVLNTDPSEARVNQLEGLIARLESKLNAVTESLTNGMTKISKDVDTSKTVMNRLVEDSVKIQGEMRVLKDVGNDVAGLRSHVNGVEQQLTAKMTGVENTIHKVSNEVEQQARANRLITVQLSDQMRTNKGLLSSIKTGMTSQISRISGLESKLEKVSKSAETVEYLNGRMAAMEETMLGVQNDVRRIQEEQAI